MNALSIFALLIAILLAAAYYFAYRAHGKRFFLFSSLGWLTQAIYNVSASGSPHRLLLHSLYLEGIVANILSLFAAGWFLASAEELRSGIIRRRHLVLLSFISIFVVAVDVFLQSPFLVIALDSLMRAASFTYIGLTLIRLDDSTFLSLVTPEPAHAWLLDASWGYPIRGSSESPNIAKRLRSLIRSSRSILAISLLGYAALQLAYPFLRPFAGGAFFSVIFIMANVIKIAHGAGLYALLLAGFAFLAETIRSRSVAEELGALVASIEHDVRNPLSTLFREAHSLKLEFSSNEKIVRRANSIERQLLRVRAALETITIMREDSNYYHLRTEVVSLREVIDESVELLDSTARHYPEVETIREYPAENIYVPVYRGRIVQAIFNILVNAMEAAGTVDERSPRVIIKLTRKDEVALVSIRDNGSGIPQKIQPLIFRPLFTTKEGSNRGLGLFIAARMIEQNQGRISVVSDERSFSEIIVSLPVAERKLS